MQPFSFLPSDHDKISKNWLFSQSVSLSESGNIWGTSCKLRSNRILSIHAASVCIRWVNGQKCIMHSKFLNKSCYIIVSLESIAKWKSLPRLCTANSNKRFHVKNLFWLIFLGWENWTHVPKINLLKWVLK